MKLTPKDGYVKALIASLYGVETDDGFDTLLDRISKLVEFNGVIVDSEPTIQGDYGRCPVLWFVLPEGTVETVRWASKDLQDVVDFSRRPEGSTGVKITHMDRHESERRDAIEEDLWLFDQLTREASRAEPPLGRFARSLMLQAATFVLEHIPSDVFDKELDI